MLPEGEGRPFVGKDVILERNLIIQPDELVVARVKSQQGCFPFELPEGDEDRFNPSMRSRYAQIGLIPARMASDFALEAYFNAGDHNNFEFQLPITNLSGAPIVLQRGTELMRFYTSPQSFIGDKELRELVEGKQVEIDGKEGREWKYVPKRVGDPETDIIGIALKIKEEGRGYIPSSREPISISGTEKQYRDEVDRFLKPVSGRKNPRTAALWIGETVGLNLNRSVTAEIERAAYPGFQGNALNPSTGEHIDSRLIDPETKWPVRVEVFSATEGDQVADWVIFRFFHQ